ncbi:PREDICTED: uncharacterized protein LOC109166616 [Ipomoea nil]|uniref:uncharacterized protein LOC109166616 n=1 Tax=Ipomoea nil TaxID=35883 RepID=UPI000901D813|nr:PREDICTED: uncharacterized protein LOC109166616 [Ipomoea nil]
MGELNYFLGLQVKQCPEGIFINQAKYTKDLIRKFGIDGKSSVKIPMSKSLRMDVDNEVKDVDQKNFRGIIGSLLYLTASRPDISFAVGVCARFQSKPKDSHLSAAKKILRYLKGTQSVGPWYPKGNSFDLVGYSDADFAGSTSGTCQFLGGKLVSWFSKKQNFIATSTAEAKYIAAGSCCMSTENEAKTTITEKKQEETEIFHDPLEDEGVLNQFLASSQYLQNLLRDPTEHESHESFHSVGNTIGYAKVDSVLESSDSFDYSPSSTPPKMPSPLRSTASSKKKKT